MGKDDGNRQIQECSREKVGTRTVLDRDDAESREDEESSPETGGNSAWAVGRFT
jgi:hypothetical protein